MKCEHTREPPASVARGRYRHFRNGREYEVLGMAFPFSGDPGEGDNRLEEGAIHSETRQSLVLWQQAPDHFLVFGLPEGPHVLYRALYGGFGLWLRPAAMFEEVLIWDGRPVPRFARMPDSGGTGL